jgi:hypothetical protein
VVEPVRFKVVPAALRAADTDRDLAVQVDRCLVESDERDRAVSVATDADVQSRRILAIVATRRLLSGECSGELG